jgi:hypothetical protein
MFIHLSLFIFFATFIAFILDFPNSGLKKTENPLNSQGSCTIGGGLFPRGKGAEA